MIIILSFPFIFYALSCFVSGAVQVYIVIVIDYRCCDIIVSTVTASCRLVTWC